MEEEDEGAVMARRAVLKEWISFVAEGSTEPKIRWLIVDPCCMTQELISYYSN